MKNSFYLFMLILCSGCDNGPAVIHYGKDQCEHCKMTIADPKYGSEIITEKGRVYKFDAIECLIRYSKENETGSSQIMITPFDKPQVLKNKDSLVFVISPLVNSPMGANLAAFFDRKTKDSIFGTDERVYNWSEVYMKIN